MANHLFHLLQQWQGQKDQFQWALVTVFDTQGSSYRKAGAHMLVNDLGQYFGLVSGGCLEADIIQQARRCWTNGRNRIVEYDLQDDSDIGAQLGIGCGGIVRVLIQPIHPQSHYLYLDEVLGHLQAGEGVFYQQKINQGRPENKLVSQLEKEPSEPTADCQDSLTLYIKPPIHILVFGGGKDTQPLAKMTQVLGWRMTLVDPRPSHARATDFPDIDEIIRQPKQADLANKLEKFDAAIVMNHQIQLDADSLTLLWDSQLRYIGILGPRHRTQRVADRCNKSFQECIQRGIVSPIGLRLGGQLPESIALSILAQIHACLENADALPLYKPANG